MGLLVLKYTSYAILYHQAADVMLYFFITTCLMSDNNRMFMSLRQLYTDMSYKPAFSLEIFGCLVHYHTHCLAHGLL